MGTSRIYASRILIKIKYPQIESTKTGSRRVSSVGMHCDTEPITYSISMVELRGECIRIGLDGRLKNSSIWKIQLFWSHPLNVDTSSLIAQSNEKRSTIPDWKSNGWACGIGRPKLPEEAAEPPRMWDLVSSRRESTMAICFWRVWRTAIWMPSIYFCRALSASKSSMAIVNDSTNWYA